ncbi:MAG: (d)CMP kinase [Bacteroidota bacterium]
MIIAIDGPAGSGKSSTARAVAEALGYLYIDTGAMYRAVALAFLLADAPFTDEAAARLLPDLEVAFWPQAEAPPRIALNGEDVSEAIRTEAVGDGASRVSALRAVREKMVALQRRLATQHPDGVVLDGRDIGTVVFPDAPVKIFLTATDTVRAQRRCEELRQRGVVAALDDVLADLRERDHRDRTRATSPLRQADDAVVVDTSHQPLAYQVSRVLDIVREHASPGAV